MKNWKNDDELLNLAFGELSDRDSQAFEAKLLGDASAQKELELLRTLRSDFTAIRDDIPEMQFSKERLREAILASGKPARPATNWLNWVLGPAAMASVAALAFVMMKGTGSKETVFVASNTKPALERVLPSVEIKPPAGLAEDRVAMNTQPGQSEVADTSQSLPTSVKQTVSKKFKSSGKRSRTRTNTSILVASRDEAKPPISAVSNPTSGREVSTDDAAITAAVPSAALAQPTSDTTPIILIDARTDSGVGAPTATEVRNPINVAIGG